MLLGNNHLGNSFAEVITIKTLFVSAKSSAIVDYRGEFRGLYMAILSKSFFHVKSYYI